jgi:hypothetical protein
MSAAPKAIWLLMSLGIVLAAEIAAALSLVFVTIVLPLSYSGPGNQLLLPGVLFFLVVVPFAGLLVGLPTWWLFVAKPRHLTLRRGIVLGMLSGLVAHPLVWIGLLLILALVEVINLTPDFMSSLLLLLPGLMSSLVLLLPFSLLSLILVGWITAAVGGIAGGLLVHLQAVLMRRMRQHDGGVTLPHG